MTATQNEESRLAIRELDVHFATDGGDVHAVDGVSLEVAPGRSSRSSVNPAPVSPSRLVPCWGCCRRRRRPPAR